MTTAFPMMMNLVAQLNHDVPLHSLDLNCSITHICNEFICCVLEYVLPTYLLDHSFHSNVKSFVLSIVYLLAGMILPLPGDVVFKSWMGKTIETWDICVHLLVSFIVLLFVFI